MSEQNTLSVPVFKLYGETLNWPTPDLIHIESIPERSRLHDWDIRAHRHADLLQLLYVQAGTAELEIEGRVVRLEGCGLQVVPALCVHGFRFSSDVQGYVLSVALPLVERLDAELGELAVREAACLPVRGAERQHLDWLFALLWREYASLEAGRDIALTSLVNGLLLWLHRQGRAAESPSRNKGQQHLQRFSRLIEAHYRQHLSVEQYAIQLGLSTAHLNALCRRLAGQPALALINQRLLLEAKRCLVYTTMNVSQIADSLGFSEPAYFSRFFKRLTAVTPSAFRRQPRSEDMQ